MIVYFTASATDAAAAVLCERLGHGLWDEAHADIRNSMRALADACNHAFCAAAEQHDMVAVARVANGGTTKSLAEALVEYLQDCELIDPERIY